MSEQLVTPENVTTKDGKINLLDLNRQQMREFFKDLGEKPFRADQVMKWMYHYCCDNFDEMTDINKVLRGKLKEVAEYAPLSRLVLETDCPYLAPVPNRGKRNSSLNLPFVVEVISQLKGITAGEVEEAAWENALKLYRIPRTAD